MCSLLKASIAQASPGYITPGDITKSLRPLQPPWKTSGLLPKPYNQQHRGYRRSTLFAQGAKDARCSSTFMPHDQLHGACPGRCWWKLPGRLFFPLEIATTNLRPYIVLWSSSLNKVFIIELTVA